MKHEIQNDGIIIKNINYKKIINDILINKLQKYSVKRQKRNLLKVTIYSLALIAGLSHFKLKQEESRRINREITIEIEQEAFLNSTELHTITAIPPIEKSVNELTTMTLKNAPTEEETIEEEIPKISYTDYLPNFGNNTYDEKYNYVEENYGEIVDKYAKMSGIDPRIIKCILAQERGKHSSTIDEGGALGVAQIQVSYYLNTDLTIHNYVTNEDETFKVTWDLLKSVDGNIKVGTTILQNLLDFYDGNLFLAVQAYNYGAGATNQSIKKASEKHGYSKEYIINTPTNLFWLDGVQQYNREKGSYGDVDYLDHVFSRYPGNDLQVTYYTNNQQTVMLENEEQKSR